MGRNLLYKILRTAGKCKIFVFLGLCLIHAKIFAQSEKSKQVFDSISDALSGKSSTKDHQFGEFFLLLTAGAVLIFVIWIAYQFYVQRKHNLAPDTAWGLYKKLCHVHNLSFKERYVIRKVCRLNDLGDPLPLFVEPNYFKHILADKTMYRFHELVQRLLEKLFSSGQESIEANDVNPLENCQENLVKQEEVAQVEQQTGHFTTDFSVSDFEQSPVSSGQEKPLPPATRVLLNPIPGRMAFSSLAEPLHRLTTEIASESIRHNLSDGRGMNERTYNGIGELRQHGSEPQSPLFPKSNVPSPSEMLASESRKADQPSPASSTPQYLRAHKDTSPVVFAKHQNAPHHYRTVTFENIAMLETTITGR